MKDIRIGNDILVTWSLFRGEEAYDLTDLPLTLYLSNAYGKKKVEHFFVEGNKVQWTFFGKDQKNTGKYSLILVVNEGGLGMQSTDVCNFVQLVSCSCQMSGADDAGVQTETIQLTSTVDFPPIVIDSMLSEHSANPVQNAVVTKAINELKEQISESPELPELVGSDWNADEGEPGFIKNKPFGLTGGEWQELHWGPDDMPVEIISYNWDESLWIEGLGQNPYIVVSDGTNSVIIKLNNESTVSKPLGRYTLELAGGILQLTGDTSEAFSIRYYVTDTIVPLDEAYIPDTIARKSDLGQGGVGYDDTELRTEIKGIKTDLKGKQDTLKSGENIKTINGESILGEGNIEITGGGMSSGIYQSNIKDGNIAMTEDYGDFKAGTTVASLTGKKTYDELFDGILFPTIEPTHDNPSVTGFTLTSSTSPVKIGTSVVGISAATLYRGKWTTYNNNLPYTGDATAIEYTCLINNITYTDINNLPEKYTQLGNQTYQAKISYEAGPAPKNNKGKEVPELAAPAGSVTSGTRTINVTLPWYASTANANEDNPVVEQKLIAWNDTAGQMATGEFALQPSGTLTQVFKIPRKLSSMEVYDQGSGKWVNENKNDYTESPEDVSIGGNTYSYYVYEYKGESRGETKLNVKF